MKIVNRDSEKRILERLKQTITTLPAETEFTDKDGYSYNLSDTLLQERDYIMAFSEEFTRKQARLVPYSWNGSPGTNWVIESSTNINKAVPYCIPGTYFCRTAAIATTLSNCPTKKPFMLSVYCVNSHVYDDTTTSAGIYRVRKILDIEGNEWVQSVYFASAGVPTFYSWQRVINGNGGTIDGDLKISAAGSLIIGFNDEDTYLDKDCVASPSVFADQALWVGSTEVGAELGNKVSKTITASVVANTGATSCTISNSAIKTDSVVEVFSQASAGSAATPLYYTSIKVNNGSVVITFPALQAQTTIGIRV